ncbi:fatty acyl-AMP ligase [Tsukamurella sp. 8F]|uniref:fatty acyl-AMP ligase n=1 Tax=unclassified Tsukamurella TaxID=2633480 RepID=UPI0023B9E110|nr:MULTISPECIES: fatty acyl-AMP ligase [unclassified Tsukamurella]MDF0529491.1 fatty acyl-AMP ligase [Tsukamurella sp. 8J]MDF0585821.1 fatty acyl-AMP ligase [Tsukamurella sp. 8F]
MTACGMWGDGRAPITDILAERAATTPHRRAYVFVDGHGREIEELTYGELYRRAGALADRLAASYPPGERALLVFVPGLNFIVGFFACLYAGMVAVPLNPPAPALDGDAPPAATRAVAVDCAAAVVVTDSATRQWNGEAVDRMTGLGHVSVDEIPPLTPGAHPVRSDISPDTLAFLQYTSGSTAAPKGVMVAHRNLIANQEMIRDVFGHDSDSTVVGWAPFFHDQGLIGNVLQPLYVGATAIMMSPLTFIRRPLIWLETISRYHARTSGGPDFAFEACVRQAGREGIRDGVDLSHWKVAFNGAEPVRADTVARFSKTFGPYGFAATTMFPCYGLAEATLLVTASGAGRGPRTRRVAVEDLSARRWRPADDGVELVGSGTAVPGTTVLIVDPESRSPVESDCVGEVWVSGAQVAQGYWRRPDLTESTMRAEIDGNPGRSWLRTGDLGVMDGSGEVYVVGRIKDLIIIRGRNYYAHDIEATVAGAHSAVRGGGCAAFAVSDDVGDVRPADGSAGDELVVVAEIRSSAECVELAAVERAVRGAVIAAHGVTIRHLRLIAAGQVPKTSSGKVRRSHARKMFHDREFAAAEGAP